jgi:hypothetical protein
MLLLTPPKKYPFAERPRQLPLHPLPVMCASASWLVNHIQILSYIPLFVTLAVVQNLCKTFKQHVTCIGIRAPDMVLMQLPGWWW